MIELKGRSGIRHRFSQAGTSHVPDGPSESRDLIVESVAELVESVATVTDVLVLYAKALDVGAKEVSLEAPSFDEGARKLAMEYGIRLKKR